MSDPTPTPITKKLKRSGYLLYINANFNTTDTDDSHADWLLIGKDVEDLSVELNPDVETKKNILDELSVNDNGYEPSISVDTYYADPAGDATTTKGKFYSKMKDIAMNRKTGDDCRTLVMEVFIDKTDTPSFEAWREEVIVKPQSYGGPQGGISIPYNIHFDGNRVSGTATFTGLSDPDKAKSTPVTFATT